MSGDIPAALNALIKPFQMSAEDAEAVFKKRHHMDDEQFKRWKRDAGTERANLHLKGMYWSHSRTANADETYQLLEGGQVLFGVTLTRYPACCGAYMLHHFSYSWSFFSGTEKEELFDRILTEVLNTRQGDMYWANRRIITMMVESGRTNSLSGKMQTHEEDIPAVEYPDVKFPLFWKYWHKKAKRINDRRMYNVNSYNVLHDLEVVL